MTSTFTPRYRQLIEDAAIPEDARIELELAAQRFTNMVGGRFSDAVAAEIANYQRLGHDAYIAEMVRGRKAIREMGY